MAPDSIRDLLLYRLARFLRVAGAPVVRICEGQFGITRREWGLLAALSAHDGLLSSQVAELVRLDRARTSRTLTSLATKGLVERRREPGDGRRVAIHLTEAGRALHAQMFPRVCDINQQLLSVLDAEQLRVFETGLERLQAQADALGDQARLPKADRRRGGRGPRGWT